MKLYCPVHKFKPQEILLKLHKMIKSTERQCSIQELNSTLLRFLIPFIKFSSLGHNSKTVEGILLRLL